MYVHVKYHLLCTCTCICMYTHGHCVVVLHASLCSYSQYLICFAIHDVLLQYICRKYTSLKLHHAGSAAVTRDGCPAWALANVAKLSPAHPLAEGAREGTGEPHQAPP